ncbi:MAG: PIG-L family deacetylase [Clostridium sp.]
MSKASARKNLSNTLQRDEYDSMRILEIDKIYDADFPNTKTNVVTVDSVISFIKTAIDDFKPDVIITHHPADTNNDHYITSIRVQETIK